MRRVVVTGLGMVTSAGVDVHSSWQTIIAGKSGLKAIQQCDVSDLPSKVAGEIVFGDGTNGTFDPGKTIEPKEQRKIDRFIQFGISAAVEAIEDSGWKPTDEEDQWRTGVMIGSGIGGLSLINDMATVLKEQGPRRVTPFFIPATLINLVSGQVSIRYGFKGPNHSVVTACATGTHAIGDAARLIVHGDADVMIAGGA